MEEFTDYKAKQKHYREKSKETKTIYNSGKEINRKGRIIKKGIPFKKGEK